MKAEELFVGALVRVNRDGLCIKKNTIVDVRAVDADDRLAKKGLVGSAHCRPLDDDQFEGGIWCEYLEPIPLTPEILEKNFEKKTFYGIYDDYFDLDIWEYSDGLYIVTYHSCEFNIPDQTIHLSWVHELQHFMRHCGIEKEITI
jgi:hypothetical protein